MSTSATTVSELIYKTEAQFVSDMTIAYGASLNILPNLLVGDAALAVFEAVSTQNVYIEFLLQIIWSAARASTATGSDLDTFVADFGLSRLPATYAEGAVTLSALSAAVTNVPIPAGTLVQTQGGAIQYQLIADTTQSAWSASLNAYVLPAGSTSITATAQATVSGAAYNVQAGQLTQFASAVAGVSIVTNGASINNGLDQETDAALRIRFVDFLDSLSEATEAAILFAANSVQQGLDLLPLENTNINLQSESGINTVIVDDGSGSPSSTLLSNVLTAIQKVRAFGIQLAVVGPTVTTVTISLTVLVVPSPTETDAVIETTVQTALVDYVNAVQLSADSQYLYLNNIVDVAKNADVNVLAVKDGSVLLNSTAADLYIGTGGLPRTTTADVTVTASP